MVGASVRNSLFVCTTNIIAAFLEPAFFEPAFVKPIECGATNEISHWKCLAYHKWCKSCLTAFLAYSPIRPVCLSIIRFKKRRNEPTPLSALVCNSYYNCSTRAHTHAHKDIEPDSKFFFADFSCAVVVVCSFSLFAAHDHRNHHSINHYLSLTIIYCFIHPNLFNLCEILVCVHDGILLFFSRNWLSALWILKIVSNGHFVLVLVAMCIHTIIMHNLLRMLLLHQSTHLAHPIDFQFGCFIAEKKNYRQLLATLVRTIPNPFLEIHCIVDSNSLSARFFPSLFTSFKRVVLLTCLRQRDLHSLYTK